MISIDKLLDMVCTEAVEMIADDPFYREASEDLGFLPMRYDTELIRRPDGSLVWVD